MGTDFWFLDFTEYCLGPSKGTQLFHYYGLVVLLYYFYHVFFYSMVDQLLASCQPDVLEVQGGSHFLGL